MNPLTNMKNVKKLSEQELHASFKTSWHDQYRSSAWIFVGGLPYDLTEGDIICVFSQYGEIVNINLVRDKDTGKSKGFCFICYEDQRSTDLAVDNFNGITILKRTIRVDHVTDYKMPKDGKKTDDTTKKLYEEGCAPKAVQIHPTEEEPVDRLRETLADQIQPELKLPPRLPIFAIKQEKTDEVKVKKEKKEKKKNKKKSKKKKMKKKSKSSSSSSSDSENEEQTEKKTAHIKKKDKDREGCDKKGRHFSNNDKSRKKKYSEYSSESSSDKDIDRQQFRNKSPEAHKRERSRSRFVEKNKHRSKSRSISNDRSRQKYKRSRSRDRTKRYNKDKSSRR